MKPRTIELRIDELVLQGLPGVDRHRLVAELEQELAERLREVRFDHIASGGMEVRKISASPIQIGAGGSRPAAQLARSILGAISPRIKPGPISPRVKPGPISPRVKPGPMAGSGGGTE